MTKPHHLGDDLSTYAGALVLAQRIRDYWAERGVHPRVWVEEMQIDARSARSSELHRIIYGVRSDFAHAYRKLDLAVPHGHSG